MKFSRVEADVFAPDGSAPAEALARTTHLCVAAHQDDIEIMAQAGIDACFATAPKSFTGVVVTDGAGSPRLGSFAHVADAEMPAVRREEQRQAARLGRYGLQLQLAHPSAEVKGAQPAVIADLAQIFRAAIPEVVYVHNPADKHDTHVAVFLRCLDAWRELPRELRPRQVLGCEVWRDLDWLRDDDKVALEAGSRPALARQLLEVFASQIQGGKRYDLAALGRRAANATFHQPTATDTSAGITWAMDLTPLVHDESLDIEEYTLAHLRRFQEDVRERIRRFQR